MSGSDNVRYDPGKEVTTLTKVRLIYLLTIASLFAYFLANIRHGFGMSDGGGF